MTLPEGTTIRVCEATEEDWDAFVESEDQELRSIHMVWSDDEIFIVELPSPQHGSCCSAFIESSCAMTSLTTTCRNICVHPKSETRSRYELWTTIRPFACRSTRVLAMAQSQGRNWAFSSLGDDVGQFNWKANRWTTFVGVRYVVVWLNLTRVEHKLHTVQGLGIALPDQDPTPVAAPATLVAFGTRVLLELQSGVTPPRGFPDPVTIDLFHVLLFELDVDAVDWHRQAFSWQSLKSFMHQRGNFFNTHKLIFR
ncbi:hypothetical protein ON010_g16258 [Phytophthora cinnamomi]|nr:hypothetical protein ON010_g16258 [Phytophthora cinnamomi]